MAYSTICLRTGSRLLVVGVTLFHVFDVIHVYSMPAAISYLQHAVSVGPVHLPCYTQAYKGSSIVVLVVNCSPSEPLPATAIPA